MSDIKYYIIRNTDNTSTIYKLENGLTYYRWTGSGMGWGPIGGWRTGSRLTLEVDANEISEEEAFLLLL